MSAWIKHHPVLSVLIGSIALFYLVAAAITAGIVLSWGGEAAAPEAERSRLVQPAPAEEIPFGEEARDADLSIHVLEVTTGTIGGQHYGRFSTIDASLVHVKIVNHGAGKVYDWAGWQGEGEIEDEHGNRFRPISMRGWSWPPAENPMDYAARIHPGMTHKKIAYYEPIPLTSRQLKVKVPLGNRTLIFVGELTLSENQVRQREAAKKKDR